MNRFGIFPKHPLGVITLPCPPMTEQIHPLVRKAQTKDAAGFQGDPGGCGKGLRGRLSIGVDESPYPKLDASEIADHHRRDLSQAGGG